MLYIVKGENKKKDFIGEIFENRGISIEDSIKYLNTSSSDVNSFNNLENIDKAVDLLKKHLENDSNILFQVDSDVDGYTSSAVGWNYIREKYPNAKLNFVNHSGKQHGISVNFSEKLDTVYDLVIVPDAGTNDFEAHQILANKGIDVLVLDHHDAYGYSEYATVVNSQLSEKYTNKNLSGVGIVWQFIRAFENKFPTGIDVNYYLDLVGLGNIADMMSLTSFETKHLMSIGFKEINNPMFQGFVKKQDFSIKGVVNPMTVGWYIGPLINAMIRVGTQEEKNKMFEAFLEENKGKLVPSTKRGAKEGDTEELVEHVARLCTNARSKQNKAVEIGMAMIDKKIQDESLLDNKILIIAMEDGAIEPALIGLVANKIAGLYKKPTMIVRKLPNTEDYSGSIRNFNNSPLDDFRGSLEESGLVNWSRGHASAAGVSFPIVNLTKLNEHFNELLKNHDMSQKYYVDFIFDASDFGDRVALQECLSQVGMFNKKGLWGQDMEEPLIAVKNLPVSNNARLNKTTLKIEYAGIEAIKFRSSEEEVNSLSSQYGANNLTVIGRTLLNEWNGVSQLLIVDYTMESSEEYSF